MLLLILASAFATGALLGAQPALNAALSRELASPFAAAIVSLIVSLLCVLPFLLFGSGTFTLATAASAPWWIWVGGVSGAVFVSMGLTVAPMIGVAFFIVVVVAGQLVSGALIDHFGLFGMSVRTLGPSRLIGLALVFAGVLVYRFGRG